ncbi:hypothetical protein S40293_10191, partial [Stachybotrys chartarum IBT 40293]
EIHI